jgi:hypothetical protein
MFAPPWERRNRTPDRGDNAWERSLAAAESADGEK